MSSPFKIPDWRHGDPMTHPLTAAQSKAVEQLNLAVLEVGPLRMRVVCPYCGGRRLLVPGSLLNWAKKGKVPTCAAVKRANRGTACNPVGEPAPEQGA